METTDMKHTGRIIKELREKAGENQEQLAAALQVANRETVARWESGARDLKREHIIALAKHFNVSADYLLGLSEVASVEADVQTACRMTGLSEGALDNLSLFLSRDLTGGQGNFTKKAIYNRTFEHPMFRAMLENIVELIHVADAYKLTYCTENLDIKSEIEYNWGKEYAFSKYITEESFQYLCNCLIKEITELEPSYLHLKVTDFEFYMRGVNNGKHNPSEE